MKNTIFWGVMSCSLIKFNYISEECILRSKSRSKQTNSDTWVGSRSWWLHAWFILLSWRWSVCSEMSVNFYWTTFIGVTGGLDSLLLSCLLLPDCVNLLLQSINLSCLIPFQYFPLFDVIHHLARSSCSTLSIKPFTFIFNSNTCLHVYSNAANQFSHDVTLLLIQ